MKTQTNNKNNEIVIPKHIAEALLGVLLRTAPRSMNDQEIVLNSIDVLHKMLQTPPSIFRQ